MRKTRTHETASAKLRASEARAGANAAEARASAYAGEARSAAHATEMRSSTHAAEMRPSSHAAEMPPSSHPAAMTTASHPAAMATAATAAATTTAAERRWRNGKRCTKHTRDEAIKELFVHPNSSVVELQRRIPSQEEGNQQTWTMHWFQMKSATVSDTKVSLTGSHVRSL
jgi:hypothetical protein